MRFHAFAMAAAIACGAAFAISPAEWTVLALAIGIVLTAELLNTAIEAAVDLVTTEYAEQARIAKDAAAGAVLIASVAAVVVGAVMFGPRFWFVISQ